MSKKEKQDDKTFSRRKFLRAGALAGGAALLGLTVGLPSFAETDKSGKSRQQGLTSIPMAHASYLVTQQAIDPLTIPKYVDTLPDFRGVRVDASKNPNLYINNQELQEKILPASMYPTIGDYAQGTYVWGYSVTAGRTTKGPLYPGFTIEAKRGKPVKATYANSLSGTKLQRLISVDQSIHWANPNGLAMDDPARKLPYAGMVPVVTHLHGGEVPSDSDGGPDAWFLPGYSVRGPAFSQGVSQTYTYPNEQEATTMFYHDHCLGATRINLYAGLVGFYFIRDEYDTGVVGTGLKLPAGPYEIELALQDKMFDTNGQLLFPDGTGTNANGTTPAGLNGPPPNPDIHPFWNPEFFGDVMLVNGKSWPKIEVEARRYRFHMVDGCNARFLNMQIQELVNGTIQPLSQTLSFWIIGTDGGLLDTPAAVSDLLIAPGERADVIIDFKGLEGKELILTNNANSPYPDGDPVNPDTNGQIMKFIVGPSSSTDNSFNPATQTLRGGNGQPKKIVRLSNGVGGIANGVKIDKYRMLTLVEIGGPGGPIAPVLNNTRWDGQRGDEMMQEPIPGYKKLGPNYLSELPLVGSTEQWDIINLTMDAHPIHLHLVQFQLINRQNFNNNLDPNTDEALPGGYRYAYNSAFQGGAFIPFYGPPNDYNEPNDAGAVGGNLDVTPFLNGPVEAPRSWEVGWKDTFQMYPGQVSRIIVRWAPQDVKVNEVRAGINKYPFDPSKGPGYVWHCHIVDHEDNEMMRPYVPTKFNIKPNIRHDRRR